MAISVLTDSIKIHRLLVNSIQEKGSLELHITEEKNAQP